MWVFGYGSLIFRPDIPRSGYIKGFKRRFWQGSTDHRGVPGNPGRVVTLIEDPSEVTWGTVLCVPADREEEVLRYLDYREKNGYKRLSVAVYAVDLQHQCECVCVESALVYLATPDNEHFLGEASLDEIASTIASSRGPSGSNADYLLRLDAALRAMGVQDDHVTELARLVRAKVDDRILQSIAEAAERNSVSGSASASPMIHCVSRSVPADIEPLPALATSARSASPLEHCEGIDSD